MYVLFHAVSMRVVLLWLGTMKPVLIPLFQTFADIISSIIKKCNMWLFLNHADVMKSSDLQCQLKLKKKSQDTVSEEYRGCGTKVMLSLARNISTDKHSGQEHCCSVETNLKCTTSQIVLTRHLPLDIVEFLFGSAGSQCISDKSISMQFALEWYCLFFIGHGDDRLSHWHDCLFFFSIAKFSVIVLLNLKQNVIHMLFFIVRNFLKQ